MSFITLIKAMRVFNEMYLVETNREAEIQVYI